MDEGTTSTELAAPGVLRALPVAMAWYVVGLIGLVLAPGTDGTRDNRNWLLSLACLGFGLYVFWSHGGPRITAVGIYSFAFALFVGFSAVYQLVLPDPTALDFLHPALVCAYFGQVTTWLLFWTTAPAGRDGPKRTPWGDRRILRTTTAIGTALTLISLAKLAVEQPAQVEPDASRISFILDAAGFCGALLLAVGLLDRERHRPRPLAYLTPLAAFGVQIALSTGMGRLSLGALGFALLVVMSRHARGRLLKLSVLLVSPAALWFLASMRRREADEVVSVSQNGLESVVSPLQGFATLLHMSQLSDIPLAWGRTFVAAVVGLVPRAVWPHKPDGFGSEVVTVLHPGLVGTGHSDAALFQGEWIYNFGTVGLLLMVPCAGLIVRGVDRLIVWMSERRIDGVRALAGYGLAIIVAVGMPDLMWVGTFTWVVRGGMRAIVLGTAVLAILVLLQLSARATATLHAPRVTARRPAQPAQSGSGGPTPQRHASTFAARQGEAARCMSTTMMDTNG
ncbi:hypothetical protein ABZ570_10455 [Micromonospora sp. NPDC007271]|uniref:hypothetical protein n=1 Tax=Micromonospora sp. NPDC007271 TaxID=3154587 RepID=UPI00340E118D